MTAQDSGALYHASTWSERLWRWLGFRYHLGDEPDNLEHLPGWICTNAGLNLCWRDRLRLLVSGRLRLKVIVHTDTDSPLVCKSRFDWHILRPGELDR